MAPQSRSNRAGSEEGDDLFRAAIGWRSGRVGSGLSRLRARNSDLGGLGVVARCHSLTAALESTLLVS